MGGRDGHSVSAEAGFAKRRGRGLKEARPSWREIAGAASINPLGTFPWVRLAEWFAGRSARGKLTRMVGAWLLVGLPVIAARIWWSAAAAVAIFVVTLVIYVAGASAICVTIASESDRARLGDPAIAARHRASISRLDLQRFASS